jgi:hypothetical protein
MNGKYHAEVVRAVDLSHAPRPEVLSLQ